MSNDKSSKTRSGKSIADDERIGNELAGLDRHTDPFVAAVHATRMPMIITNPRLPDNPVVFANDAFCRLTGYSRDEIVGRNCRFLQGSETDPATRQQLHDAVAGAYPIEIDVRNYRKNGEAFWNRLLLAPVFDDDQTLAYFFASQVDVTIERDRLSGLEKHNAALMAEVSNRLRTQQERERELTLAMRAGGFGTWSFEITSRTLTASDECKALFGYPVDHPFRFADRIAALHPDDRQRAIENMARSSQEGLELNEDYRLVWPDGTVRWVSSRGQPFFDTANKPVRIAGVSMDVTDTALAEMKRRGLVRLTDRFHTLDHSDQSADMSYIAAEILGQTLGVSRAGYGLVDPVQETIHIERDWNAPGVTTIAGTLKFRDYGSYIEDLKRGKTAVVEDSRADSRTAETSSILESISARSFINMPLHEQGGFVALIFVNHAAARLWSDEDIAFVREVAERTRNAIERRRAERELANLAASLERQVAERTTKLMAAEDALRQSQKMEAVGQLTGGLAHDFNNLLAGISGSLELMQNRMRQGRFQDTERYMAAAQGAAKRAAALTHRLLAFSRRQTLDPKPTDVNRLVSGMQEMIQRTVGPGIQVEMVGASGLWPALVDPSQLENALLNLCLNARDAMPDGGHITVETGNKWFDERAARQQDLPEGQYLSMCVTDTGTGMAPELIARVFEPFFTTKPIGEGTGLGLSMIYGFAKQSGGQVRIYSEVGKGTTVCIYLPRYHGTAPDEEVAAKLGALTAAETREATVLIVDDEPTVRMLVADVLDELGYTSIEAGDSAAGLQILLSDVPIDLLVTDVGLPGGMNGRQMADAARVKRPDLKVLFITGYAENAALGNGQLTPGMAVMSKPFAMDAMAARIRSMIEAGKEAKLNR